MEIYLWIYAIALLLFFIKNKKVSNFYSLLYIIFLSVVCIFRSENVGADTSTYLKLYETDAASERYSNEFLFYLIPRIARSYGLDKYGCQVIMGMCFYIPFLLFLFKKCQCPAISLLIFLISTNRYFFETFNITRQMAAVPMVLWAISYYYEKKFIVGSFFLFLGCGFHMSALFSVPFILICYFCSFSKKVIVGILLASIIWAFMFSSAEFVSELMSKMTFLDIVGLGKYIYLEGYRPEMERSFFGLIVLLIPHNFLCFLLYHKTHNNFISRVYLCGVFLLNIVAVFPISYRFALCLTALDIIIVPALLLARKNQVHFFRKEGTLNKRYFKYNNIIMICFIFILYLYSIWSFTSKKDIQKEFVPYESFL